MSAQPAIKPAISEDDLNAIEAAYAVHADAYDEWVHGCDGSRRYLDRKYAVLEERCLAAGMADEQDAYEFARSVGAV